MESHKKGESVSEAASIQAVLPRHTVKALARLVGVPPETARSWLYKRMPLARRREIAAALLAECDRLEQVIADTRRHWAEAARDEASGAMAVGETDRPRPAPGRVGGAVK